MTALSILQCVGQLLVDATEPTIAHTQDVVARTHPRHHLLNYGVHVGRYVVLEHVGAGATGVVYAAYDPELDRKIALKLLRAQPGSESKIAAERLAEVRNWMDLVDLLLVRTPGAFSNRTDALAASPWNPELRLILQGDLNLQPHKCGEHYWIVEELRRHFGYAVDVAMALPHSADWRLGQHDAGTGYSASGFAPGYQPYSDTRATDYRADGVQSTEAWQVTEDMSGPLDAQPSWFPWWAATFRGKRTHPRSYSERHDLFILVGQGWAGDDPVLNYAPMNVQNEVASNPLHPDNRAVATLISTDCTNEVVPWDSPLSYAPSWPISPCGTMRGAPALHTDHIPIGARLRVW